MEDDLAGEQPEEREGRKDEDEDKKVSHLGQSVKRNVWHANPGGSRNKR
jgi:hypothetical protein